MDPISLALGLGQFVPSIIKLFGGSDKHAEIADKVLGVAQAITGTSNPQDAVSAIHADPAKVLDFQQAMAAQELEMTKAFLADGQSARHMQEVAMGQDDVFTKRFTYYFAGAWSLFSMFYLTLVTFWPPLTEAGKANSGTILGFLLGTAVSSIFSFLYGTTRGSELKSKMLAALQPNKQ